MELSATRNDGVNSQPSASDCCLRNTRLGIHSRMTPATASCSASDAPRNAATAMSCLWRNYLGARCRNSGSPVRQNRPISGVFVSVPAWQTPWLRAAWSPQGLFGASMTIRSSQVPWGRLTSQGVVGALKTSTCSAPPSTTEQLWTLRRSSTTLMMMPVVSTPDSTYS